MGGLILSPTAGVFCGLSASQIAHAASVSYAAGKCTKILIHPFGASGTADTGGNCRWHRLNGKKEESCRLGV